MRCSFCLEEMKVVGGVGDFTCRECGVYLAARRDGGRALYSTPKLQPFGMLVPVPKDVLLVLPGASWEEIA